MTPIDSPLVIFAAFVVLFLALAWASRQIGLLIQEIIYLLTGSSDLAMVILFLVYLPGILVHEGAHWLMAKLLGLKTGQFRVWPRKRRKHIGLGSVNVAAGGPLRDSLVGMAPLIVGSLAVVLIGGQVFDVQTVGFLWRSGGFVAGLEAVFDALLFQKDGLLWGYFVFAIANAMMPSASDREPLKSLALYVVVLALLFVLVDQNGQGLRQLVDWLVAPAQFLASAFLFTAILDGVILSMLYVIQAILAAFTMPAGR